MYLLGIVVYPQCHLAHLQPLVSEWERELNKQQLVTSNTWVVWEGRGSQQARGPEVVKNPKPGILIASELWELHPPVHGSTGTPSRASRQEAGAQKPRPREYSDLQTSWGLPAFCSGSPKVTFVT